MTWDGSDLSLPDLAPLNVVALGGGHGLSASLSALRRVVEHVTAISRRFRPPMRPVSPTENGGKL